MSVYLQENFFWEEMLAKKLRRNVSKKIKGWTNFIVNGLVGNIYFFLSDISDVKDVKIKKRFHSGG